MAVAIAVINFGYEGPEFPFFNFFGREGGFFSAVRHIPFFGGYHSHGVRCIDHHIIALFGFSVGGGVFTHIHVSLFRDVVLEKPGVYRLAVLADGFPVESIPLAAEEVKTEEAEV